VRLVVLGDPVAHSLSPLLHTVALAATGITGEYTARRVDHIGLGDAVAEIRTGALSGANVTMPHKEAAAGLCDRLAGPAVRIGAVNTLVKVGGEVVGHTTDVDGVRLAWTWAGLPDDAPVLLLGAGGAAAAACVALAGRVVMVSTRRPEAADALVDRIGDGVSAVPWGTGVAGAVVVNATPLGMHGEPLPVAVLADAAGLLDMAYGTRTTPAAAAVSGRGLPVADGPTMLLGQAVESFRLWTGRVAPVAAMRAALDAELARRSGAAA